MRRCALLVVLLILTGLVLGLPAAAQDAPIFVTNTPRPPALPPGIATPDAPASRYALRLWLETDLVTVLEAQVRALSASDTPDARQAVRLTQYELGHRFPGAPRDPAVRARLLEAMLAAPPGSVDMRTIARARVLEGLTEAQPGFATTGTLEVAGFLVEITPANFNGDSNHDALLHLLYPADAVDDPSAVRYDDVLAAEISAQGSYRALAAFPDTPAAPLPGTARITVERLGDVNGDRLDELAVLVQPPLEQDALDLQGVSAEGSGVNSRLILYGWRADRLVDLAEPGSEILAGSFAEWPLDGSAFTTVVYRVESPEWDCIAEQRVRWEWAFNAFRGEPQGDFTRRASPNCFLFQNEPLFARPLAESISLMEGITTQLTGAEPALARARMVLIMLYTLNGQTDTANGLVNDLASSAAPGSWLAGQVNAYQQAVASGQPALAICAAVQQAEVFGACDVDAVLARLFSEQPLSRAMDISGQLQVLGLPPQDVVTISEVGRFDRTAVRFDLAGDRWWLFAPLQPDTYTAEPIDPPPGFISPDAPPNLITPPAAAFTALIETGNAATVLNLLANAAQQNPNGVLSPSSRYLQALSFDLLGNRTAAQDAYFRLWSEAPADVYGQLAADHLERR